MASIAAWINTSPLNQPSPNNASKGPLLTVLDLKHNTITITNAPINHKLKASPPQYQFSLSPLPPVRLAPYNTHKSPPPALKRNNHPTLSLPLLPPHLPTYDQATSLSPLLHHNKATSIGQWTLDPNCLTWTRRLHHHGSGTTIASHGWTRSVSGDAFYRRRQRTISSKPGQGNEKWWLEGRLGNEMSDSNQGRKGIREDVECVYGLTSRAGGEVYICCEFGHSDHHNHHHDGISEWETKWEWKRRGVEEEEREEGEMGRGREEEECNLPTIIALVAKHRFAYHCDCDWWSLSGRRQVITGPVDFQRRKCGTEQESRCVVDEEEMTREREREALRAICFTSRRPCGSLGFWNGSRRIKAEIRKHDQFCGCGCFGSESGR